MEDLTTNDKFAHDMKALNTANLIGGMLIGVTAAFTAVRTVRYFQRKAIRINRRNKKENALKSEGK